MGNNTKPGSSCSPLKSHQRGQDGGRIFESVLYVACWQQQEGQGEQTLVHRPAPPTDHEWSRAFIDRGRGLHAEITHSALTVSLKLVTGDLTSVFLIILIDLICSFRVNLFQFLKASSYSCGISCHDCGLVIVYFTSPLDEDFNIYKTAHRIWLRILSIALEKELKVLDYV